MSDPPGPTSVGRHTYGLELLEVRRWSEDDGELRIGAFCSIADRCIVLLGGNHRTDWVTTYPFPAFPSEWPTAAGISGHPASKGDVTIGNDVWLGSGATIFSGVTIGDGAVVAANATVTRDVPPYTIVAGNPARVVRPRFPPERVEALLRLRWWEWDDATIAARVQLLCSDRVDELIALDGVVAGNPRGDGADRNRPVRAAGAVIRRSAGRAARAVLRRAGLELVRR